MSTDPYFGIGGSYRLDATGNRVPAESWPDDVIAASAPINTTATLQDVPATPEPIAFETQEPEPAPTPAKTPKTSTSTPTDKE